MRLFEDRKVAINPEMGLKEMWGTPTHQITKKMSVKAHLFGCKCSNKIV
ncbi:MAG: hypothetical protein FWC68_05880 [Oscillospiraceae bacterium]|nr:hypothetical protein [Oscillospiraceae bacterium]